MKRILVTGGGGFVGKAIVRMAIAQGIDCVVVGRNEYPEVAALGAQCLVGDIGEKKFVQRACRDVDTVFHVAALAGIWGGWEIYHRINVRGTENIVTSCKENGIRNLVYTSTPSVVFNKDDIVNGDETLPYASEFLCNYAKSKVLAEKYILTANSEELSTCALRPHLIWGPGDPHLIPRLLQKGKQRLLKQVGGGNNLVDISFIENVAHAHILAGKNLSTTKSAAGKAYFISQGEPVNLWEWINELFERVGIARVDATVPFRLAYAVGAVMEGMHTLTGNDTEPRMTRFLAEQLAKSHYFSIARARKDLGYVPIISTEEGMRLLIDWIQRHEKELL